MMKMNADDDKWTLLQSRHEGKPFMLRARTSSAEFDRATYPTRLNIFWQMRAPDGNGLASETCLTSTILPDRRQL